MDRLVRVSAGGADPGRVGSLAVQLVTEAFERIRTRDLFARFVPEDVVDEVLKSADGLRLGGVQREGTVMFTDLRGFTSFSEVAHAEHGDRACSTTI